MSCTVLVCLSLCLSVPVMPVLSCPVLFALLCPTCPVLPTPLCTASHACPVLLVLPTPLCSASRTCSVLPTLPAPLCTASRAFPTCPALSNPTSSLCPVLTAQVYPAYSVLSCSSTRKFSCPAWPTLPCLPCYACPALPALPCLSCRQLRPVWILLELAPLTPRKFKDDNKTREIISSAWRRLLCPSCQLSCLVLPTCPVLSCLSPVLYV